MQILVILGYRKVKESARSAGLFTGHKTGLGIKPQYFLVSDQIVSVALSVKRWKSCPIRALVFLFFHKTVLDFRAVT